MLKPMHSNFKIRIGAIFGVAIALLLVLATLVVSLMNSRREKLYNRGQILNADEGTRIVCTCGRFHFSGEIASQPSTASTDAESKFAYVDMINSVLLPKKEGPVEPNFFEDPFGESEAAMAYINYADKWTQWAKSIEGPFAKKFWKRTVAGTADAKIIILPNRTVKSFSFEPIKLSSQYNGVSEDKKVELISQFRNEIETAFASAVKESNSYAPLSDIRLVELSCHFSVNKPDEQLPRISSSVVFIECIFQE